MIWNVFIDGDNVPIQRFINCIQPNVYAITGCSVTPLVFCQSNQIFKYQSKLDFDVIFRCCKTQNKNATDARIIFETGKAINNNERVVIVSNDNIFKEIESDDIIVVQFNPIKQPGMS